MSTLIVVNHYDRRPNSHLEKLLDQLRSHGQQVLVVINSDETKVPKQWRENQTLSYLQRPNAGMNIGAWHTGFLAMPDHDYYLFLQDECVVENDEFLEAYIDEFSRNSNLGMLGESINPKWLLDWEALRRSGFNVYAPEHLIGHEPARRVDCYLYCLKQWGIDPGKSARHLRSLVWFLPGEMMFKLGGFPEGKNKGKCIAAEIGVSRKIEQLGYAIKQARELPFSYIWHAEWQRDGFRKIW